MKRIFLIRHAKSSWSQHSLPDIDRPLNERGYKDAHSMSEYLLKSKISPDIFLSSPAIRAMSTALIFSRTLNFDEGEIIIAPKLYESTARDYLRIIREQDDRYANLFLVAHNPTISEVFNLLTSGEEAELPTCTVAIVECPIDNWKNADHHIGKSGGVINPSQLSPV